MSTLSREIPNEHPVNQPVRRAGNARSLAHQPSAATEHNGTGHALRGLTSLLIDVVMLGVVAGVIGVTIYVQWKAGVLQLSLTSDPKLSWHLVRAAGMTAYGLLGASTVWGLFLSSRFIKDWSPGPVSLLFHASLSWLAVVVMIVHVALLLFDKYVPYRVVDLLVPFVGPYRPLAVGLGTIAAWLTLAITVSFSMRKRIGQRFWRLLHYTSYFAFGLVTVHSITAGSDASRPGMQLLVGLFTILCALLLSLRIFFKPQGRSKA